MVALFCDVLYACQRYMRYMRYLDLSSEIVSRNSRFLTPSLALARLLSFVLSFVSRWQGRGVRALWVMCHLRLLRNVMEIVTAKRNGNSICKEYTPFVTRTMMECLTLKRRRVVTPQWVLCRNGKHPFECPVREEASRIHYVKSTPPSSQVHLEYMNMSE